MTTLAITAFYHAEYHYETKTYTHHTDQPTSVGAQIRVSKDEQAALLALFPKYVGLKAGADYLWFNVSFPKNKTTGDKNETAIKRYAALLKAARKAGIDIVVPDWNRALNRYENLADFHTVIGVE